jgi:hypothetical protein
MLKFIIWIFKVVVFSAIILASPFQHIDSYTQALYTPVYQTSYGRPIVNASWSNDSMQFVFQEALPVNDERVIDTGVVTDNNNWYSISMGEDRLDGQGVSILRGNIWFLESETVHSSSQITLALTDSGQRSFSFPSPNGRYLVYVAPKPSHWKEIGYPLTLTDLQTGENVLIPEILVPGFTEFDAIYVTWSESGTAFTVETTWAPAQYNYYISGYSEALENIQTIPILVPPYEPLQLLEKAIYYPTPLDLTKDGKRVLIEGRVAKSTQVFIWDVFNPELSFLIQSTATTPSNSIRDAVFTPDEDAVLYIGENGLVRYHIDTGETAILAVDITSIWVDEAWFSPDGKYVALLDIARLPAEKHKLYILEVPDVR